MKWRRLKNNRKKIAISHVNRLFELSLTTLEQNPQRARRYVEIARNIIRRHKIVLSKQQKMMYCKECNMPLVPGKTARVRTRNNKIVITCGNCGALKRYPFTREKKIVPFVKCYDELKTQGGLICVDIEHDGKLIKNIHITGDFFMYPEEKLEDLEKAISGQRFKGLHLILKDFFKGVETPGITPDDFLEAINKAAKNKC